VDDIHASGPIRTSGTARSRVAIKLLQLQKGSRRGPVNDRETTRNNGLHGIENALLKGQIAPSPQVRRTVPGTLPRWGSRVRIPSSAQGNPQVRSDAARPTGRASAPRAAHVPQRPEQWRSPCRRDQASRRSAARSSASTGRDGQITPGRGRGSAWDVVDDPNLASRLMDSIFKFSQGLS
jgi:hypothetical protein